jgi:hypothetical protein
MEKLQELGMDKVISKKQKPAGVYTICHSDSYLTEASGVDTGSGTKPPKPKGQKLPPAPVFTHKEIATQKQRVEILDWLHSAEGQDNQSRTARHFDAIYPNLKLKQSTISKWVKREAAIRAEYEQSTVYT